MMTNMIFGTIAGVLMVGFIICLAVSTLVRKEDSEN